MTARGERHGAIAAECAALTGVTPDGDGIATGAAIHRIRRAAYVQHGLRVIAAATDFDELLAMIAAQARVGFEADRFRVEIHDPSKRLPMTGLQTVLAVADIVPDYPDLNDPQHRFVVVAGTDRLCFGEVVAEADKSYRQHDSKPWTTSSSLDSRLARCLVNLVPDAQSILDPCCGAGSIVIEAASLGLDAFGVDWKPAMAGMTRENLAHFGYVAGVEQADSRRHVQPVDAVVTDLPYGHAIDSDEGVIRSILEQCATQAPVGVFVAPTDISTWLVGAGYAGIGIHTVMKRRGFTRWIHVARSTSFDTG